MKKLMCLIKRVWLNKSAIYRKTFAYVGIAFTFWGFVSLFNPLDGILDSSATFGCKLMIGLLVLIIVAGISLIISTFEVLNANENIVLTSKTGHKVVVQYGDMYSPDIVEKGYKGRRNIVISVNRCFDTIVDDNLISRTTQHGRIMRELYNTNEFDENSLNAALQQSLSKIKPEANLSKNEKPKGNRKRYACGTVAELIVSDNLTYFFLGLSKFDNQLAASTTKAEYVLALQNLIEFCNVRSQGYPVILPLMGTGLSRANISHEEALSYMVSALHMNNDIINCDFHIVVWKGMKDKVSIKNL